MHQVEILFPQLHKTATVPVGASLSEACRAAGVPLDLVCGGAGTCGKCRVLVRQEDRLESVLACRTMVTASMEVVVPPESLEPSTVILESGEDQRLSHPLSIEPLVRKMFFDKKMLSKDLRSSEFAFDSIQQQAGTRLKAGYRVLQGLDRLLRDPFDARLTVVMTDEEIIDLQPGNTTGHLYGAAVDIGTTTLVMYIIDLNTGKQVMVCSDLNPQRAWGADVISRIQYCRQSPEGTLELQRALIDSLNRMIQQAAQQIPDVSGNVYQLTVCGNTTMQHLFHGFHPGTLGEAPYRGFYQDLLETKAGELDLHCPPAARVFFLPVVGGFVGADTVAVLLSIRPDHRNRLVIDLGTNGEIAVGTSEHYWAASTACGPALEGAGIQYGMRAAAGAVESFGLADQKPVVKIIGNEKATGLCGSGVVDVLAVLLQQGIIDMTGRLLDRDTYLKRRPESTLSENLVKLGNANAFQVVSPDDSATGEGVYLTQKDVRQIQLAKSAIQAGCRILLEKAGLQGSDLDEILLSGAFGNYIHLGNARLVGLIPHFNGVLTRSIGNGAGTGVQRALLNTRELKRSCEMAARITHVDLACDPDFQQAYLLSLNFVGAYESGI